MSFNKVPSLTPPAALDDERQPLLGDARGDNPISNDEENPHLQADARPKGRSWKKVVMYGVLTVVGVVLLGFFIKGFMDTEDVEFDLEKTLKAALGGGLSGAAAMVLQVLTLMPLRTVMNYQYRYGTTTTQAIITLHEDGGWKRYYQGLSAALVQGPVSRFGDTAANAGILVLLQSNTYLKNMPAPVKTIFASLAAAAFRMILTPIDTIKTTMQTQGKQGLTILRARVKMYGIGTMWYGALATAAATFVGHYPWFATNNYLEEVLPVARTLLQKLSRRAFIGFVASIVSDSISNSLRVVKTYRQVNETRISYVDAARSVIATDGLVGLFGRGLKTRFIANGLQGLMFSILWKFFMDLWNDNTK